MQPKNHSSLLVTMTDENEEKVIQLLTPPILFYIRELSKITRDDPEYLAFHSASVALRIRTLMDQQGGKESRSATDHQIMGTVREAIARLKSFEK